MEELSQEYLSSKEKEKKFTNEMDRLEAEFRRLMTRLKNIWTIGRTNYRVWQLTCQKILADVESKKASYEKVSKSKLWRTKLSENKVSLVKKKI